jgi:dihydroorotate dehydrogenase/NAD-dependent dihydropyrimidine dehydrogenase PreA subunit
MAGPGGDTDGWVKLAKALEQAGADALELNFNCPNMGTTPDGGLKIGAGVGKDPDLCYLVTSEVKKAVTIPVIPKICPEAEDLKRIFKTVERAGADGVVINAGFTGAPPIDIHRGGRIRMAGLKKCSYGGTVGAINKTYSNRMVGQCAQNTGLMIAGGGGISDWADAVESIMFGSTLTTVCTKIIVEGFPYLKKLNEGVKNFMEANGYETLGQMRGLALNYICETGELHDHKISEAPKFDLEKCSGCGSCAKLGCCDAIEMRSGRPALASEEKCQRCGLCAAVCAKEAICF